MPTSFTLSPQTVASSRWNFLPIWIYPLIPINISDTRGSISSTDKAFGVENLSKKCDAEVQHHIAPVDHSIRTLFFIIGLIATLFLSISAAQAGTATLSWNASSGSVTGYRVYYGQVSGSYATVKPDAPSLISGTTYTTPDLPAGTYYFAVKAFDSTGNSSGYSNQVSTTITATVAAPTANFSANKTTGSAPLTINFTDGSTGSITGWSWNFGDGTTSTAQNPSKTYSSAGAYTVKLTVTGSGGSNTATKTNYITVTTPTATAPVASFTAGPASGSAPLLVTFTDTSVGSVTRRSWNFGDGTTSTAQNPVKTYNAPGTYTAKLTVGNSSGITSATKTISATAIAPVASFSASPRSGAAPLAVSFTNTSTGTITSYSWTFGDGGTSTASNPTYTYTKAGTYTVSLATTGPAGSNTKTLVNHITVSAAQAGGGLVAAYNFEETSGATVVDISGNSNHGTISGATRTTSGKYGKALSFDGASNWVTVNDSASLDLTTSVTVEAWIYPNNLDSGWWYCVLAKDHSGGASYYLAASSDRNQPEFGVGTEDWSWYKLYGGPSLLQPNTWVHLAATYDGAIQRLYVNGSEVSNRAQSGRMMVSDGALHIGGSGTWNEFFRGRIDEVRIYNRALSAGEIQTDMNTAVK